MKNHSASASRLALAGGVAMLTGFVASASGRLSTLFCSQEFVEVCVLGRVVALDVLTGHN